MRRYRAQDQERAAHAAYVQARRVRWFTDRLLREQPVAAALLAEGPYELAADVVEERKQRL